MNMLDNFFMGILSCEKYKERRVKQDLSQTIFDYMYFVGDSNLSNPIVEGNTVLLPCPDSYEHLPKKTHLMIKWILENKPNADYIFKTDDDIKFNFQKLQENSNYVLSNNIDYSGNLVSLKKSYSVYHFGKCDGDMDRIPVLVEQAEYCSGGGYFLSRRSAEIIKNNFPSDDIVFEDYYVGKTLNDNRIFPAHLNLHNNSCFW